MWLPMSSWVILSVMGAFDGCFLQQEGSQALIKALP